MMLKIFNVLIALICFTAYADYITKRPEATSVWGAITGNIGDQTDLSNALSSKLDDSMNSDRLLGRSSVGVGSVEEISEGTGISLSSGTLSVLPSGSTQSVQYNNAGSLGGDSNFLWDFTNKKLSVQRDSLGTTTNDALLLRNTTAATISVQYQTSPSITFEGNGWKSSATAGSKQVLMRLYNYPEPGTSNPRGRFRLDSSIDGGAWSNIFSINTGDATTLTTPLSTFQGRMIQEYSNNNSSPGITDHLTLKNPTGSTTILSFATSSQVKSSIQTSMSNGSTVFKTAGTSPTYEFQIGSTISSTSYILQIYSGGLYVSGGGFHSGSVTAGMGDTSPPGTLTSYGSTAVKSKLVDTGTYTAAATETALYCDTTLASTCTGTPSTTACSSYGSEGACTPHSPAGCSWNAGTACSIYNGDGVSCSGQAGCSYESLSCSGQNNTNQTACEDQNTAFGGSCSWNTSICPTETEQAPCQAITGCTWNSSACSAFDGQSQSNCETNVPCAWTGAACSAFNGTSSSACVDNHTGCSWFDDGGNCGANGDVTSCEAAGCYWDGATCAGKCSGVYDEASTCVGEYNTSCTGDICQGNYDTGNCLGTFGSGCVGTAACTNITSSTPCAAESGCSWTTGITLALPAITAAEESSAGRVYNVKKIDSGGGAVTIVPSGTDTIEGSATKVLTNQYDSALLHPFTQTTSCASYNANQSTCETGKPTCTYSEDDCSNYSSTDEATCEAANAICSWSDPTCSGGTFNKTCSGTFVNSRKWYLWKP